MTGFKDLARENARLAKNSVGGGCVGARQQGLEQTGEIGKGVLRLDS
jgi:hypothetical protein